MTWYLVWLLLFVLVGLAIVGWRARRGAPRTNLVDAESDATGAEADEYIWRPVQQPRLAAPAPVEAIVVAEEEPDGPQLRVLIHADLMGQPGYFATRWEPFAPYRLAVEVVGADQEPVQYELLQGMLIFWRGGRGKTVHDAGYMVPDEDFAALRSDLQQQIERLQSAGWTFRADDEQVERLDDPATFNIQVRSSDQAYDASLAPGPFDGCLLELRFTRGT